MNKNGTTVWIDETIEVLAERLKPEKEHRPLIKNLTDDELKDFLYEKLEERKQYYAHAKIHLKEKDLELKKILSIVNS